MIRENRVEELAEPVGHGEATADGAQVVFTEAIVRDEVRRGRGKGLAAEVVAAPAEEERDVESPAPAQELASSRRWAHSNSGGHCPLFTHTPLALAHAFTLSWPYGFFRIVR